MPHDTGTYRQHLMTPTRMATNWKQPTMRTRLYFWSHASSIFWSQPYSASGHRSGSRCGRTVIAINLASVRYAVLIPRLSAWFMVSMVTLGCFNLLVLLDPPKPLMKLLELMNLPLAARATLLLAVVVNVVTSLAFESYGTQAVSRVFGVIFELRRRHRVREGKIYKAVEGGMR